MTVHQKLGMLLKKNGRIDSTPTILTLTLCTPFKFKSSFRLSIISQFFFTDVLNATRNLASNGLRGYATTLASAFAPIATGTPWLKLQPELFTIGTFHPDLCHKQPNNICF